MLTFLIADSHWFSSLTFCVDKHRNKSWGAHIHVHTGWVKVNYTQLLFCGAFPKIHHCIFPFLFVFWGGGEGVSQRRAFRQTDGRSVRLSLFPSIFQAVYKATLRGIEKKEKKNNLKQQRHTHSQRGDWWNQNNTGHTSLYNTVLFFPVFGCVSDVQHLCVT